VSVWRQNVVDFTACLDWKPSMEQSEEIVVDLLNSNVDEQSMELLLEHRSTCGN